MSRSGDILVLLFKNGLVRHHSFYVLVDASHSYCLVKAGGTSCFLWASFARWTLLVAPMRASVRLGVIA
jgi:hypothetical protein